MTDRKSASARREIRGTSRGLISAASGRVIHSGTCIRVPSGCRTISSNCSGCRRAFWRPRHVRRHPDSG